MNSCTAGQLENSLFTVPFTNKAENNKTFFLQVHTCYCGASLTNPSSYIQFFT